MFLFKAIVFSKHRSLIVFVCHSDDMVELVCMVSDAIMVIILSLVMATSGCAFYLAFSQKCNRHIVPGLPCEGSLFVRARDGVFYAIPQGKAVIKTDVVREVHCGRVALSSDQHGIFAYVDENEDEDGDEHRRDNAVDQLRNHWSVGSVRSQDMTLSLSDDESVPAMTPPESPLAGEMVRHEGLMI